MSIKQPELLELIPNFIIIDLSLYHISTNTLIISDVHIGYEEALNKTGILIPFDHIRHVKRKLLKILHILEKNKLVAKNVIIAGDLKHEFGTISKTEWSHTLDLIDFLKKEIGEITLIKGNHDKIVKPIMDKGGVNLVEYVKLNNTLIIHGDKLPDDEHLTDEIDTIIIGHEHPAVSITKYPRVEHYKCFLKGTWGLSPNKSSHKYKIIVIPSFNLVTEGTDILKHKLLSPYLKTNKYFDDFEVFVVGDKSYFFGTIMDIKLL